MKTFIALALLLISTASFAEGSLCFAPVHLAGNVTTVEYKVVGNMPPVRSQGGLPICSTVSAWTLLNQKICEQNNSDCKKLDPDYTVSMLALSGYGLHREDANKFNSKKVIPFSSDTVLELILGKYPANALVESCYPYDRLIAKYGNDRPLINKLFKKYESEYFKKNRDFPGSICLDCLKKELAKDFGVSLSTEQIQAALNTDYFDKFLYEILIGSCDKKVKLPVFRRDEWPGTGEEYTYDTFIAKVHEVLDSNTPVAISMCLNQKAAITKQCDDSAGHSTVISGHKKICDLTRKTCKDLVKIHNSWGQSWQDQNDDGWVDARTFFECTSSEHSITWLKAKK